MNKLLDDLNFIVHRPKQTALRLLNMRDELSYLTILREIFIHQAYHWLITDLKPDTVALDIGAYRGETAIYLAMPDKVAKVIAVEPSYRAYNIAKKHIMESHLGRKIKLLHNAITEEKQKISDAETLNSPLNKVKTGGAKENQ